MNISLTDELEEYVSNQVKTGHYKSASEVIREALRNQIRGTMEANLHSRINSSRQQVIDGEVKLADSNYFQNKRNKIAAKQRKS